MGEIQDYLIIDDTYYKTKLTKKFLSRKKFEQEKNPKLKAIIPGIVRNIFVTKGSPVNKGDKLLTLEAMKMNNIITSPFSGIIKSVNVKIGQTVIKNEILVEFE